MRYSENGSLNVATLDDGERADLERLGRGLLTAAGGRIDTPEWVGAARRVWEAAPVALRRSLREFRRDSGEAGAMVVRNLPVDEPNMPDTPMVDGSVRREATLSAATLMLIAHGLGDPAAFRAEKSGALVQDVVPVPGRERLQANSGSVRLTFHTENAFHQHRPDFVLLLCVRPDHDGVAELRTVCSRQLLPKLSDSSRRVLASDSFVTEAPPSFGAGAGDAQPHPVLPGALDDPDLRVDEAATQPVGDRAEAAMAELRELFDNSFQAIRIQSGHRARPVRVHPAVRRAGPLAAADVRVGRRPPVAGSPGERRLRARALSRSTG
jgi:L-asparagine oxygenase